MASLDGQISFFDPSKGEQTHSIEGRQDLGSGRSETDVITAKKSEQAKWVQIQLAINEFTEHLIWVFSCYFYRAFTTLCYSADGNYIIAAGQSKNVCIYHVAEGILVKKFEITQNRSLDAVDVSYHPDKPFSQFLMCIDAFDCSYFIFLSHILPLYAWNE